MKLKCIDSRDQGKYPAFIVGKEYEVYDREGVKYYVVTENGTYMEVIINGSVWKFEPIEDEKEEREEKEDILFEIKSLISQLDNEFNKLKKLI